MSKAFGQRPYMYLCPSLQNTQNQFTIDAAVYFVGTQHDIQVAKEVDDKIKKEAQQDGSRNRINYKS